MEHEAAIADLDRFAKNAETNVPIQEAEGDQEGADNNRKNAAHYRTAIALLEVA